MTRGLTVHTSSCNGSFMAKLRNSTDGSATSSSISSSHVEGLGGATVRALSSLITTGILTARSCVTMRPAASITGILQVSRSSTTGPTEWTGNGVFANYWRQGASMTSICAFHYRPGLCCLVVAGGADISEPHPGRRQHGLPRTEPG